MAILANYTIKFYTEGSKVQRKKSVISNGLSDAFSRVNDMLRLENIVLFPTEFDDAKNRAATRYSVIRIPLYTGAMN